MAISTYKTYLLYKDPSASGSSYSKLIDIKDFPDLGGTPETLDTTTLSNSNKTAIPGLISLDTLEFSCNYDSSDYDTVKALENKELDFIVAFGTTTTSGTTTITGEQGKFKFKGKLVIYVTGGGVNEVVGMKIAIACSTDIVKATETISVAMS